MDDEFIGQIGALYHCAVRNPTSTDVISKDELEDILNTIEVESKDEDNIMEALDAIELSYNLFKQLLENNLSRPDLPDVYLLVESVGYLRGMQRIVGVATELSKQFSLDVTDDFRKVDLELDEFDERLKGFIYNPERVGTLLKWQEIRRNAVRMEMYESAAIARDQIQRILQDSYKLTMPSWI